MISGSLAKRYAKALFELSTQDHEQDKFLRDLEAFIGACKVRDQDSNTTLLVLIGARHIPTIHRLGLVDAISNRVIMHPTVTKFLRLVVERGRADGLELIARHFRDMVDVACGRMRAVLCTPQVMDSSATSRVRAALERATGKQIILETMVDPKLIGGVVARVGNYSIDRSIRRSLDQLRDSLQSS